MASKMKGVFSSPLDSDLDDLLPPQIPAPDQDAQPTDVAPKAPPAPSAATPKPPAVQEAAAPAQPRPRRRRTAGSTPTAEVAPEVYKALRKLTNREKARDPITARTYAQVVLDAIEHSQAELATV